jgi:dipeptidyl aminopeptidase/acylaminoacyl peptidase
MSSLHVGLAAMMAAVIWAPRATAAAQLSAFGGLPTIEQIAVSPDGKLLAIDLVKGEQRSIVVQDLTTNKIVTGIKVGDLKVRRLLFAAGDHIIITTSQTSGILGVLVDRGEWFVASDFNLATRKVRSLLGDVDYAGNFISSDPVVRTIGGKPTLFVTGIRFLGDEGQATLFRIDLDTDRSSPIIDTPGEISTDYLVAADGKPAARVEYDAPSKRWELALWQGGWQGGSWRPAEAKSASIETPNLVGFGRDGRSILIGQLEDGVYTVRELSPDGVKLSEPLPWGAHASPIHDPLTHQLIGVASLQGDERRYQFFDHDDDLEWKGIQQAFGGGDVALASWSDDRKKIVVRFNSPADGPGYALVDLTNGSTKALGLEYPGLTSADISPVRPVSFKAADGLEISGYLTLPQGRDPKKLPLVVFPHGGPAARDEPGFDWWAQAMASRGYAVLQVNYRGSEGFGWKFMSAGFGEWGGKMQTDLSDGVRFLAAQGTIDPAKVCVVGASYGGYAALAGATIDTGVYRCAVDVAGPSDLARLISWGSSREGRQGIAVERYWDRYMGAKGPSDPRLAAISPAFHADKVSIPILIIQGKDDTVVPFEQSQIMADALKKAGKPYEFVILNHEDHWLSRSDTRLQMLQATMDFLAKNNPPG